MPSNFLFIYRISKSTISSLAYWDSVFRSVLHELRRTSVSIDGEAVSSTGVLTDGIVFFFNSEKLYTQLVSSSRGKKNVKLHQEIKFSMENYRH